ncbi:MAG: EAL domain-containing protein [Actinomycetota bacterium]|nr:EAL domain-containing protein [Actinomycetota bacterium]
MSAAGIASWRLNESLIQTTTDRQDQLSEAQEVARLGSWEWNVASGRLTWSDQLYRLTGVTPDDFAPFPEYFTSLVYPDDRAALDAEVRRAVETGQPYAQDFRVVLPDGSCRTSANATESGEDKVLLAQAIVSLAQALHLKCVAEGVETAKQLATLTELGCDFAQGYYLARPKDLEALLRTKTSDILEPTAVTAALSS